MLMIVIMVIFSHMGFAESSTKNNKKQISVNSSDNVIGVNGVIGNNNNDMLSWFILITGNVIAGVALYKLFLTAPDIQKIIIAEKVKEAAKDNADIPKLIKEIEDNLPALSSNKTITKNDISPEKIKNIEKIVKGIPEDTQSELKEDAAEIKKKLQEQRLKEQQAQDQIQKEQDRINQIKSQQDQKGKSKQKKNDPKEKPQKLNKGSLKQDQNKLQEIKKRQEALKDHTINAQGEKLSETNQLPKYNFKEKVQQGGQTNDISALNTIISKNDESIKTLRGDVLSEKLSQQEKKQIVVAENILEPVTIKEEAQVQNDKQGAVSSQSAVNNSSEVKLFSLPQKADGGPKTIAEDTDPVLMKKQATKRINNYKKYFNSDHDRLNKAKVEWMEDLKAMIEFENNFAQKGGKSFVGSDILKDLAKNTIWLYDDASKIPDSFIKEHIEEYNKLKDDFLNYIKNFIKKNLPDNLLDAATKEKLENIKSVDEFFANNDVQKKLNNAVNKIEQDRIAGYNKVQVQEEKNITFNVLKNTNASNVSLQKKLPEKKYSNMNISEKENKMHEIHGFFNRIVPSEKLTQELRDFIAHVNVLLKENNSDDYDFYANSLKDEFKNIETSFLEYVKSFAQKDVGAALDKKTIEELGSITSVEEFFDKTNLEETLKKSFKAMRDEIIEKQNIKSQIKQSEAQEVPNVFKLDQSKIKLNLVHEESGEEDFRKGPAGDTLTSRKIYMKGNDSNSQSQGKISSRNAIDVNPMMQSVVMGKTGNFEVNNSQLNSNDYNDILAKPDINISNTISNKALAENGYSLAQSVYMKRQPIEKNKLDDSDDDKFLTKTSQKKKQNVGNLPGDSHVNRDLLQSGMFQDGGLFIPRNEMYLHQAEKLPKSQKQQSSAPEQDLIDKQIKQEESDDEDNDATKTLFMQKKKQFIGKPNNVNQNLFQSSHELHMSGIDTQSLIDHFAKIVESNDLAQQEKIQLEKINIFLKDKLSREQDPSKKEVLKKQLEQIDEIFNKVRGNTYYSLKEKVGENNEREKNLIKLPSEIENIKLPKEEINIPKINTDKKSALKSKRNSIMNKNKKVTINTGDFSLDDTESFIDNPKDLRNKINEKISNKNISVRGNTIKYYDPKDNNAEVQEKYKPTRKSQKLISEQKAKSGNIIFGENSQINHIKLEE